MNLGLKSSLTMMDLKSYKKAKNKKKIDIMRKSKPIRTCVCCQTRMFQGWTFSDLELRIFKLIKDGSYGRKLLYM